jgi:hypothetical protein
MATKINPLEIIRMKLGDFTDDWLMRRAKETGRYEVEDWLWFRVSEVESMLVEGQDKEKIGEEM